MNGRLEPANARGSTRPLAVGVVAACFLGMVILGTVVVAAAAPSANAASLVEGFDEQAGQEGQFSVAIEGTNAPVEPGADLVVRATVTAGTTGGTEEVVLAVAGVERDATTLTLQPGRTETVTLTWSTGPEEAGSHEAEVATDRDSDAVDVQVGDGGNGTDPLVYPLIAGAPVLALGAYLFRDRWVPFAWPGLLE